jgi:hypothetical protein
LEKPRPGPGRYPPLVRSRSFDLATAFEFRGAPVGHYRVPIYLRGKTGSVEAAIEPAAVDNEEEGYGRNAGSKLHYYRVAIPMTEIWPDYVGSPRDGLRIEVFETWLERI